MKIKERSRSRAHIKGYPGFFLNCMDNEILKYALDNGMIDLSCIKKQVEMTKKQEVLNRHPYKIWQSADGNWYTYLPKQDGGRRLVKRKTEQSLQESIFSYWKDKDSNKFKERFTIWVKRQKACGRSDNTIYKYEKDYNRFFKGDIIENQSIKSITDEDISKFIARVLQRKNVPWRALKGMFGYINGVFEKAIIDGVVDKNPCKYVDLPIFKKQCVEVRRKSDAERTISKEEKNALFKKITNDENAVKYAVEFSFSVGMRVGEIAALRWDDINFSEGIMIIQHSEKYNQKTGERTVESTKTGKSRVIPLTDNIKKVLFRVRDYELRNGTFGEFVFMEDNKRVTARKISNCINNNTKSDPAFTCAKSIHSVRRTINSNMRKNGVSATVAGALLGHSEKVNEVNYTCDVSSMQEKKNILSAASL